MPSPPAPRIKILSFLAYFKVLKIALKAVGMAQPINKSFFKLDFFGNFIILFSLTIE